MKLFSAFTSSDTTKKPEGTPETTATPPAEVEASGAADPQKNASAASDAGGKKLEEDAAAPAAAREEATTAAAEETSSTAARAEESTTEFCSPPAAVDATEAAETAPGGTTEAEASSGVAKDSGTKKLDGESRIAAQQIGSVLSVGRSRTREEVEAEYRKLRNDLTNMRRRLNVAHQQLDLARAAVENHVETLPAEFRATWTTTTAKIAELQEEIDKDLGDGAGDNSPGGSRRQRVPRRQRRNPQPATTKGANAQPQQQRQRQGRLRGEEGEGEAPGMDANGAHGGKNRRRGGGQHVQTMHGAHHHANMMMPGHQMQQYIGGVAIGGNMGGMLHHHHHPHADMEMGGAPKRGRGAAGLRQTQRGGAAAGGPQRGGGQQAQQKPGMSASEIAIAQKVRDQLRGASTAAEVESVISNARTAGLTHEVSMATKLLNKLQAAPSKSTEEAASAAP